MKFKFIFFILVVILLSNISFSSDLIRFSGQIIPEEETAMDFCMKQTDKDCNKADFLNNEKKKSNDCLLIDSFDLLGYIECREDSNWYDCYKESNMKVCIERGAN